MANKPTPRTQPTSFTTSPHPNTNSKWLLALPFRCSEWAAICQTQDSICQCCIQYGQLLSEALQFLSKENKEHCYNPYLSGTIVSAVRNAKCTHIEMQKQLCSVCLGNAFINQQTQWCNCQFTSTQGWVQVQQLWDSHALNVVDNIDHRAR